MMKSCSITKAVRLACKMNLGVWRGCQIHTYNKGGGQKVEERAYRLMTLLAIIRCSESKNLEDKIVIRHIPTEEGEGEEQDHSRARLIQQVNIHVWFAQSKHNSHALQLSSRKRLHVLVHNILQTHRLQYIRIKLRMHERLLDPLQQ